MFESFDGGRTHQPHPLSGVIYPHHLDMFRLFGRIFAKGFFFFFLFFFLSFLFFLFLFFFFSFFLFLFSFFPFSNTFFFFSLSLSLSLPSQPSGRAAQSIFISHGLFIINFWAILVQIVQKNFVLFILLFMLR